MTRYVEDQLFELAFPLLKRVHRIPRKHKVEWHKHLRGYEVDVYITWRSHYGSLYKKTDKKNTNLSSEEKTVLKTLDKYGSLPLKGIVEFSQLPRRTVLKTVNTLIKKRLIKRKPITMLKSMVIELKENDIVKALDQALKRRNLALFTYVVINLKPAYLFRLLIQYHLSILQEAVNKGIGLISVAGEKPVLLLRAEMNINRGLVLDDFLREQNKNDKK